MATKKEDEMTERLKQLAELANKLMHSREITLAESLKTQLKVVEIGVEHQKLLEMRDQTKALNFIGEMLEYIANK